MSFDMMEARLDGMLVDKVETAVGHVVIVGGSDGWGKIFIGLPFSNSFDQGVVVAVDLNWRKGCPLGRMSLMVIWRREQAEKAKNMPVASARKE